MDRLIRNLGENIRLRHEVDPLGMHYVLLELNLLGCKLNTVFYCIVGRVSGLIVDTPSSFATGSGSGPSADNRYALIKACIDAYQSTAKSNLISYLRKMREFD